jgi:hypothetical protein
LAIKGNENEKRPKNERYRRVEIRKREKMNTKIEMERRKLTVISEIKGIFR